MGLPLRAEPDSDSWSAIHDPAIPLVLEEAAPPSGQWVHQLLAQPAFVWRVEGAPEGLSAQLSGAPAELRDRIDAAADRFARVIGCDRLKLRVEVVDGNACTKVHADYTDVRLIQTLAGPGTDYAPTGDPHAPLTRVPTGWVGLFKGALYPRSGDTVHAPCLHRSPPIAGSGLRRLVLVIDRAERVALDADPLDRKPQVD